MMSGGKVLVVGKFGNAHLILNGSHTAFLGSPYHITTLAGLYCTANPAAFEGLPGVFDDSLPDGWGRLLIDRELERLGSGRTAVTPVDRLAIVGTQGMGALIYRPEERSVDPNSVDLEWFADLAMSMAVDASVEDLSKARAAAGGSAGARPKLVALLDVETGRVRDHALPDHRIRRKRLYRGGGEIAFGDHLLLQRAARDKLFA